MKGFSLGHRVRDVLHFCDLYLEGFLTAEKAKNADSLANGLRAFGAFHFFRGLLEAREMEVMVAGSDQHWTKSTANLAFYLVIDRLPPFDVVFDQSEVVTLVATPKVPYCEVSHNYDQKGGS